MKFSIVLICKNEEKTLPRLFASLEEFKARGGETVILDTGSTDKTVEVARAWGAKVTEVGEKFVTIIDEELAKKINDHFVEEGEEPIVKAWDRLFDFAAARNYATSLASNDMICTLDADEAYTRFDLDQLNRLIEDGYEQFEYQFVFAHDGYGRPAIQFIQSKFFDRRKMKWVGVVHEVLQGNAKRILLGENIIKLEHWQQPGSDHRSRYLTGLALDCFEHPESDRNSHYLGREMLWTGRPKSAIKELKRHITMDGWPAEKAQSMIFIGDAYGRMNQPENQIDWYNKALYVDPFRREAYLKIAAFYRHNNKPAVCAAYATAALEIPWVDYYANERSHYENFPHELLYWAKGWMGDTDAAKEHLLKAFHFQPTNPQYIRDSKFYFEYPCNTIDGWMSFEELTFLYETGKQFLNICEVGSWKGRSTHALASGAKRGKITAVDTWKGSDFELDDTNWQAKQEDIFALFKENTKEFTNIITNQKRSVDGAKDYADKSFDMIFIDAGHRYEDLKEDIEAWLPKAKMMLCGHDYLPNTWMGVVQAVDEKFGKPDEVHDTIWVKYLVPKVTFIIPTLGRPEGLQRCLDSIKNLNYPQAQIETIVLDGEGTVPQKMARGLWQAKGEYIVYASNDVEFEPDSLYNALQHDKGLVAFNTGKVGPDEGNICEHFIIKKDFIKKIGGEIFDTDFHHIGVDNLLWAKAKALGEAVRASDAVVKHHHFSNGAPMDPVYQKGWSEAEKDRELLKNKLAEVPKIPKRIFTIWLSNKPESEWPELVRKCIATHALPGYEWKMITLDNCFKGTQYIRDALNAKQWVKAADYLRFHYCFTEGGIYLDSDIEMLPGKNFDHLLHHSIFAAKEENGFVNSAVMGAEKGCPLLKEQIEEMETRFKGDDNKPFESSIEIFTPRMYKSGTVLEPETFYPYNHQTGTTKIKDFTICYHYFMKSWV